MGKKRLEESAAPGTGGDRAGSRAAAALPATAAVQEPAAGQGQRYIVPRGNFSLSGYIPP